MKIRWLAGVCLAAGLVLLGCGRSHPATVKQPQQAERRCTVWLQGASLPSETFGELTRLGVDEVVLDAGSVDLGAGVPVMRVNARPAIPGGMPFGALVHVKRPPEKTIARLARPVWEGLKGAWPGIVHARELLLDLPRTPAGTAAFVTGLSGAARMPVIPVLSVAEASSGPGKALARAAGGCVVLLAGNLGAFRPGAAVSDQPFSDQLAPLAGTGLCPRAAIVLTPRVSPDPGTWPDDVEPLSHPGVADLSTPEDFDWAFHLKRGITWSGKTWKRGDTIEASWLGAARLNADLHELTNVTLPEVGGWDLVGVTAKPVAMGMGLSTLKAYLKGEGPAPDVTVKVERSGRKVRVTLRNPTPFCSALSSFGNWVEVSIPRGLVAVSKRGSFDRLTLGSLRSGTWRAVTGGTNAVRFFDTFVAPGETARSGWIRVPSWRTAVTVRWRLLVSTGETISGRQLIPGR
ncbi:MAG: hypothetical protein GXP48_00660 [Acidobacteria bacterium]|nr:hypothetical protein [Acidobacteriota bacterium]